MEAFVTPGNRQFIAEFLKVAKRDPNVEFECKLLSGQIQTKDVADRLMRACENLSTETKDQIPYMTVSYKDKTRVTVTGVNEVHRVCMTNSFKGIPVSVEKKELYGGRDTIDATEIGARFTLRRETHLRKDTDAKPNDPTAFIRVITRKSYTSKSGLFQVDISMVKSRKTPPKSVSDVLKEQHTYEVEVEFVRRDTKLGEDLIVNDLIEIIGELSKAFYQTQFLLSVSDIQRYENEFRESGNKFYNLVTLERQHIRADLPHNILEGYTVTNKADGERCGLYVARDRKLLRVIGNTGQITWTGYTALSNAPHSHIGDFVDGEYIAAKNLFCIFDVYRFRTRDTKGLPLMLDSDDKTMKDPLSSRLGCGRLFVQDLQTDFTLSPTAQPVRIETKLFFAGDDMAMEESIREMLRTEFEYETDGLIFTPRASKVAPPEDRNKNTWVRVYKWKPPQQNSIDFLLRFSPDEMFDVVTKKRVKEGQLYVSRSAGDDIVYPRETMTGEYVPKALPADLQHIADTSDRVPSLFQPISPADPDAYKIYLPLNDKGVPVDEAETKIENNTIVECAYDTETSRWNVMRTRYDKTYQYRVLRKQQYGNDVRTANSVWSSIHIPVTLDMIQSVVSAPFESDLDSDMYYRDDLKRNARVFADVYDFHLQIKEELYKNNVRKGDTLLELASGHGGDLQRWIRSKPSKVVGMDLSLSNITSPTKGAAIRYIREMRSRPKGSVPPTLFVQGDMTHNPLFDQEDKYLRILKGEASGSTEYLRQFDGLNKFDSLSCQFALHYACESEEKFKAFAQNIRDTCNGTFFGTCSDGKSIYSLLFGKETHSFGMKHAKTGTYLEAGKYTKEYTEAGTWEEDGKFGMPVKVLLESFEQAQTEYLVPFEKVVELMEAAGFELAETALFGDIYSNQNKAVLNEQQQTFSFLNRSFVFRRRADIEEEEEIAEVVVPTDEPAPAPAPEAPKEDELPPMEWDYENMPEGPPPPALAPSPPTKPRFKSLTTQLSAPTPAPAREAPKEPAPAPEEPKPVKRKLKKAPVAPEEMPILFFGPTPKEDSSQNFSNQSAHPITVDDVQYKTVEHFIQAQKAKLFGDEKTYTEILKKAKTPSSAKKMGGKIEGFVTEVWESKQDEIYEKGVRAKFVQHPSLRKQLTDTGEKMIGEADPRDFYWGIGTGAALEKAKTPSKWKGMNKMGKLLMKMRKHFQDESV
jgi:ribA/ribD-fused uncharacterized protein